MYSGVDRLPKMYGLRYNFHMTVPNTNISITDSHNLDEETSPAEKNAPKESEAASTRALEKQGIFLVNEIEHPERAKPLSEFSRDLAEVGGIEIMPTDDKE